MGPVFYGVKSFTTATNSPLYANTFSFFKFIYLFIYFWLCWVFLAARRLSLVAASGGYSSLRWAGFSLRWLLLLGARALGTWAQQLWLVGSRAQAQQLWHTGFVAPWHMGSSRTRARTHVPCIGRRNHCTTREALQPYFFT